MITYGNIDAMRAQLAPAVDCWAREFYTYDPEYTHGHEQAMFGARTVWSLARKHYPVGPGRPNRFGNGLVIDGKGWRWGRRSAEKFDAMVFAHFRLCQFAGGAGRSALAGKMRLMQAGGSAVRRAGMSLRAEPSGQ